MKILEKKQKGKRALLLSLLIASISLTACDSSQLVNNKNNISTNIKYGTEDDIEYNKSLVIYGINTNDTLSDEYKEKMIVLFSNIIESELPSRQMAFQMKSIINTSDFSNLTFEEIIQKIFDLTMEEAEMLIESYSSNTVSIDNTKISLI